MATEPERLVDRELTELLDRIETLLAEVRQRVGGTAPAEGEDRSNGD